MVLFFVFYIFIKKLKWESEINKSTHRMSVSDRKSLWDPLIHVITVYKKSRRKLRDKTNHPRSHAQSQWLESMPLAGPFAL